MHLIVLVHINFAAVREIIAAKPTAAFDAKFGNFVFSGDQFTQMVYAGL